MKYKKKEILFSVLVVVATAVIFFVLGYTASFLHGPQYTMTTEISHDDSIYLEDEATPEPSEDDITTSTTPTEQQEAQTANPNNKIDLNTATKEELMTVPGIGETYALRILEYRETVGLFVTLEELKEIQGVGEKRYAQWIQYFTIS